MRSYLRLCLFVCTLYPGNASTQSRGSSPGDYAGEWVMKLGQRNFMVLTLRIANGNPVGTLSRPKHMTTGDGVSFSEISSITVTDIVVRSSIQQGHLHFVAQNSVDKTDEDDFDMTLTGKDRASLKAAGFPFDPWTISRVHGVGGRVVAGDWDSNRTYTSDLESNAPNADMRRIFEEDQKPRQFTKMPSKADWAVIEQQDAVRRDATLKLLATDQLHTAKDFEEAAFVFQHGDTPEDYLLAHTLAIVAMAKGHAGSAWIASATLDRYLQSIGKPQIYGTQFRSESGKPNAQDPYNRDLISDALRRLLGVPSIAAQQHKEKEYNTPAVKSQ